MALRRPSALASLLSLAALAAPARGQGLLGHPDCPCVDPWDLEGGGAPKELTYVDVPTGRGCLRGEAGNCFPLDYGAKRCFAWDVSLAPRCASQDGRPLTNAPTFCNQPWCYVDGTCRLLHKESRLFQGRVLYYSYATCGAEDFFSAEALLSTLRHKVLTAGVPTDSSSKLISNGLLMPSGWTADFMNHLISRAGATVKIEEITMASLQQYPLSTYSACTRDVALGLKDFCYGGFWETPERLQLSSFTPIYDTELMYLYVPGTDDTDLGVMIRKAYQPFDAGLWLLLIGVGIIVGFAMWIFGEVGETTVFTGIVMGVQMAALKIMGHGGGWDSCKSRSGSLLLLGFSFMSMIVLASYTANLANFLLMANMHTGIKDLNHAVEQGVRICTLQAAVNMFSASYPSAAGLLVPTDDWIGLADAYKGDECGAVLMPPEKFEEAQAGAGPFKTHGASLWCKMKKVGEVLLAVPVSMPMNSDLLRAFGYLFSREKFAGALLAIQNRYKLPESECPVASGLQEGATPMSIADLLGGFLVLIIVLVIAAVMHFFGFGAKVDRVPDESGIDHSDVMVAVRDLETALRNRGLPVQPMSAKGKDNFHLLLAQAKANPRATGLIVSLTIALFLTCSVVALIAKLNEW